MRIIEPTEPISVEHPVVLIVGQPGICKTSLGYSFNTLLLDFDGGAHRAVNRGRTARLAVWRDLDLGREAYAGFSGVTLDTVERCLGMATAALLAAREANYGSNGSLNQRGWAELKRRFGSVLETFRSYELDVLLLAHAKDTRDGDTRQVRADIPGGSYGEVMKRADFVGYLSMQGGRRVLDFSPTDRFIGKNPAGWPPIPVPPAEDARSFMAELFDEGRKALGVVSAESARVAAAVDAWRRELETYSKVEQFSMAIARVRALEASDTPVYHQARHLLWRAAKACGMVFDASTNAFRDTGRRPEASTSSPAWRTANVQAHLWAPNAARVQ
jgi:hypothetical protein